MDEKKDIVEFVGDHLTRFANDVKTKLGRRLGKI
jgi:hypothetical protein